MTVKLQTEHHYEFLSLKGGCRGSPESTLVKMPPCWKSHVVAQIFSKVILRLRLIKEELLLRVVTRESICIKSASSKLPKKKCG